MSDDNSRELIERPSFLPSVDSDVVREDNSLMNQYCKPPRLKIVQALTAEPFKPPFTDKDAVVIPQMIKVGGDGEPFSFTPIYFFPSWACWNPLKMKATLPAIREWSTDPNTEVARKARKFIKEPCPENAELQLRYCEHHSWYCMIHDVEDLKDLPVIFPFVRGGISASQNLIGLIQTRKSPKYACRFQAIVADHKGKEGNWYGFDFINDNPLWVEEDSYNKYRKLAEDLKKLVDTQQVEIDHGDSDVASTVDTVNSEF